MCCLKIICLRRFFEKNEIEQSVRSERPFNTQKKDENFYRKISFWFGWRMLLFCCITSRVCVELHKFMCCFMLVILCFFSSFSSNCFWTIWTLSHSSLFPEAQERLRMSSFTRSLDNHHFSSSSAPSKNQTKNTRGKERNSIANARVFLKKIYASAFCRYLKSSLNIF